ncbi:MAG: transposase [Actinobacteria bacterium]|nr:transposase [Actinomycetota bacterium]
MIGSVAVQGMLGGMPEAADLRHTEVDGQVVISVGTRAVSSFPAGDGVMRNLAAVTMTELGFTGRRVGEVLGLTEQYVSMLRGRAHREGSAGLIRPRGRPLALGAGQRERARRWRAEGLSDTVIAGRLQVHPTTVGRALRAVAHPPATPQADQVEAVPTLVEVEVEVEVEVAGPAAVGEVAGPEPDPDTEESDTEESDTGDVVGVGELVEPGDVGSAAVSGPAGGARIGQGSVTSRYGGAMLLHPFLDRVDAAGVLGAACAGSPRRYDDLGVLTATCLAFALGTSSVEATKHLIRSQVGPLAGLAALPELRTLRPRLAGLAEGCDPLGLQRRLATAMLAADAPGLGVYFVDDHFVPYAGAKPVPKGYNTKRRHAQRGRDDTVVTDYHGRAVCFASGDPSGLSVTLPPALAQLREVLGADAKIMLGFDRGGSYPTVFRACRAAGADWLTWRRGPLAPVTAAPVRSFRVGPGGICETITLADETVEIDGYGPARQLTLFEHGAPVLQVLTSDTTAPAAALLAWLRCRWRIENAFKYLTAHHGIDSLCDYHADVNPDTTMITNPARVAARKQLVTAEAELADAERALAQLLGSDQHHTTINKAIPAAETRITTAQAAVRTAKTERDTHPAKLPANVIDPDVKRARLRTHRRALQMVLRLLAYNAELWLATRLNTYLQDPDEYRAITRNLLHLGGTITYTTQAIIVTLDRPATPRLTHALRLLLDEINHTPPRLPGDRRPITYTTK